MTLEEFIDELRLERHRQRIRSGVLAAMIETSHVTFSGWETGRSRPSDPVLRRWAAQLGVRVPGGIRGWVPGPAACGTLSGYQSHKRSGESACEPCLKALRDYTKDYRARRRREAAVSPP